MNVDEIEALVKRKEKENIKVELKSFNKLFTSDKQESDDILFGIIAFANCFGGKMIFGVDNSGNFEGKFSGNIDKVKENIYNLTRDKISPSINLQVYLLEGTSWEVIIVDIPKRERMPIAFIQDRKSHEIRNRVYYIRTAHGKKLVSDAELLSLFTDSEDDQFAYQYRLSSEFNSNFQIININSFIATGNYSINSFLNNIPISKTEEIKKDLDLMRNFMLELYPYLFLSTFATFYRTSWFIHMRENFGRTSSGTISTQDIETESHSILNTQKVGFTTLKETIPNFEALILNNVPFSSPNINLPKNSHLSLQNNNNYSTIKIDHSLFEIQIRFTPLSYGAGLNPMNPVSQHANDMGPDEAKHLRENFYYFDCGCYLEAKINYDKTSYEEANRLRHYIKTMNSIIKKEWDMIDIINKLPSKEIRSIYSNTQEILRILQGTS